MTSVHNLLLDATGGMFVAFEFERTAHVFRLGESTCVSKIDTIMDGGGRRFAIVAGTGRLVAGAYSRNGISCYDLTTGEIFWSRRDLKSLQTLRYDSYTRTVSCFFEGRGALKISPADGSTIGRYQGVKDVFFSRYHGTHVFEEARPYRIRCGDFEDRIKPLSFGVLDVAFAPDCVALSEAGGGLRIFQTDPVGEIGRFDTPPGSHFLSLCYCDDLRVFAGIIWSYENGGMPHLQHFDRHGKAGAAFPLEDGHTVVFVPPRRSVITSAGREVSWQDGKELFRYAFPQRS